MFELTRKHYLLKKTLDELGLVPDWKNIKFNLINLVLKDMAVKNEGKGKFINFGYEHRPGEIPESLSRDLGVIQASLGDSFFEKPLNPRIQEVLQEYKASRSFDRINANYFQLELSESMFAVEN